MGEGTTKATITRTARPMKDNVRDLMLPSSVRVVLGDVLQLARELQCAAGGATAKLASPQVGSVKESCGKWSDRAGAGGPRGRRGSVSAWVRGGRAGRGGGWATRSRRCSRRSRAAAGR